MGLTWKISIAVAFLAMSGTANAFEKFIPLGTGYSTDVSSIPPANSDTQAIIAQSDIYETEIYNKIHEQQIRTSHMNRFLNNPENSGSDFSIDY